MPLEIDGGDMGNDPTKIVMDDELEICDACGLEFDRDEIKVYQKRQYCSFCSNLLESDEQKKEH
jgi:hypothetical protein